MLLFNGKTIEELIQTEKEVLERIEKSQDESNTELFEHTEGLLRALEFSKQCIEKQHETAH